MEYFTENFQHKINSSTFKDLSLCMFIFKLSTFQSLEIFFSYSQTLKDFKDPWEHEY